MSNCIATPKGMLCFPHVVKPRPADDMRKEPRYECSIWFPEGTNLDVLKAACNQVAAEQWPKGIPTGLRLPFKTGESVDNWVHEPGGVMVNAWSSVADKPGLYDEDVDEMDELFAASAIYAGCEGRLAVRPWAYDTAGNKGVSFALVHVQKTGDGEHLTGDKPKAADVFGKPSGIDLL